MSKKKLFSSFRMALNLDAVFGALRASFSKIP